MFFFKESHALIVDTIYIHKLQICMKEFLLLFYIVVTAAENITFVADGCTRLIQPPESKSDVNMFARTLEVNCYKYYNVYVNGPISADLLSRYGRALNTTIEYEKSYSRNEHVQYLSKSWLSMAAADPLSLTQRQAKECNAHLLKSFFGNEDILNSGPVFIKSLEYMSGCFNDTTAAAQRTKENLMQEFNTRVSDIEISTSETKDAYLTMRAEHDVLMAYRPTFRQNIIDNYARILSV